MANFKYQNNVQRKRAIAKSNNEYRKRSYKAYTFRFHKVNDKDIIETLDHQDNRLQFIKKAIRKGR